MKSPTSVEAEDWLRCCVQAADSVDLPNKSEYIAEMAILSNLVYKSQTILKVISEKLCTIHLLFNA